MPKSSPNIVVVADPREVACVAADFLTASPVERVGLATGATFTPLYDELARRQPDWRDVEFVMLDEYVGLAADDPRSFRNTILRALFDPLGLRGVQLRDPDTVEPVDVQLLGIGRNGHIGFNEPGSPFASQTRIVTLTRETRVANSAQFGGGVPRQAITRGIATILESRRVVLLATGEAKAFALANALEAEPHETFPASALQRHDDVTIVADRAAAALLESS